MISRMDSKKIIMIAPYWGENTHLGTMRINRMIKWLFDAGYEIVLINAGKQFLETKMTWGRVITIKDPVYLFAKPPSDSTRIQNFIKPVRDKKSIFRSIVEYFVFFPDRTLLWSLKLLLTPMQKFIQGNVEYIISSSPPESPHFVNYILSKKNNAKSIIDMRDGWIDDSLKDFAYKSWIKKKIEERLEKKILHSAFRVFVSSEVWGELLVSRLKQIDKKTAVITNAYPEYEFKSHHKKGPVKIKTLLYAGRFRASRNVNTIESMLDPIIAGVSENKYEFNIKFFSQLTNDDYLALEERRNNLNECGFSLEINSMVSKNELFEQMEKADGLLLLAVSKAAIPAKLFEYIPTGKPILAITPKDSAVWKICSSLSQVFLVEYPVVENNNVKNFFEHIKIESNNFLIPQEYFVNQIGKSFIKYLLT